MGQRFTRGESPLPWIVILHPESVTEDWIRTISIAFHNLLYFVTSLICRLPIGNIYVLCIYLHSVLFVLSVISTADLMK